MVISSPFLTGVIARVQQTTEDSITWYNIIPGTEEGCVHPLISIKHICTNILKMTPHFSQGGHNTQNMHLTLWWITIHRLQRYESKRWQREKKTERKEKKNREEKPMCKTICCKMKFCNIIISWLMICYYTTTLNIISVTAL